jgi:DNA-binding CsgD family transcriptional regulator
MAARPYHANEGPQLTRFRLGEHELVVLSYPKLSAASVDGLTQAERAVLDLLLQGKSNAQIAERRGTSPRTVANPVASVFRKLDVGSRADLAAGLARGKAGRRAREEAT